MKELKNGTKKQAKIISIVFRQYYDIVELDKYADDFDFDVKLFEKMEKEAKEISEK